MAKKAKGSEASNIPTSASIESALLAIEIGQTGTVAGILVERTDDEHFAIGQINRILERTVSYLASKAAKSEGREAA